MTAWIYKLAGLALALLCCTAQAADAAPPPIEQFFQNAQFGSPALSPDGKRLAFRVAAKGGRWRLGVLDLQTMKPAVAMSYENADISNFQWVNDRRLVFTLDVELTGPGFVDFGQALFAVNHDGSDYRQLVQSRHSFFKDPTDPRELLPPDTHLLQPVGRRDGDDVYVITPQRYDKGSASFIKLQRLNTMTGRAVEVDAPMHAFGWVMDQDGALRVVVTRNEGAGAVHYRAADGNWQVLAEFDARAQVSRHIRPLYLGPDGLLYVSAPAHGDKAGVYTYDIGARKLSAAPVLASKDFDLAPGFMTRDGKLAGLRYTIDAEVVHWLDPQMGAWQAAIDTLLPKTSNRVEVARRPTTPFLLLTAFADVQPSLYFLYNTETKRLVRLGAARPDVVPGRMSQTDFVRYKARDGLEIPAYLTLPQGEAKKNLPLVVLVHGGPWVRGATWGWDPEVQFLASRGYAVLQPEFRGSTGFGSKHFEAGFKQWGRAMQTDLADGARWAIAQGIADAKRICIAGASYGGYATLMGLAQEPELFRCGINWVGVTDIELMYTVHWSDFSDEYKKFGMPVLVGDPVADAALLKAASPLANAAKIKQPLLMAYGAWDVRVPIVHGEKFRDAVKPHNAQVEWVVYEKEGHGWFKAETRIDFWGRVEKFLARNLAPQ